MAHNPENSVLLSNGRYEADHPYATRFLGTLSKHPRVT